MHHRHMVEDQVEIEAQEAGQGRRRAHAQDIDVPGRHNGVHRPVEVLPVRLLQSHADLLHVRLHHHGQDILVADAVVGHLDALDGGELGADHLLQGLLHGGIAVIAQFCGKAHHRGLADADGLAQAAGGHEGRLVIGLQNEIGNQLLSLGEGGHIALNHR